MQATGLPSNIFIISLQTYKNKVSKVVILVVIFPGLAQRQDFLQGRFHRLLLDLAFGLWQEERLLLLLFTFILTRFDYQG